MLLTLLASGGSVKSPSYPRHCRPHVRLTSTSKVELGCFVRADANRSCRGRVLKKYSSAGGVDLGKRRQQVVLPRSRESIGQIESEHAGPVHQPVANDHGLGHAQLIPILRIDRHAERRERPAIQAAR